jgi:phytoene dehydrogenase-like protein
MEPAPVSLNRTKTRIADVCGGSGGLAAALRLQAAGYSTVIFEARDKLGRLAYVLERDGFIFDVAPTVITAAAVFVELFAGARTRLEHFVEFIPTKPFYRLILDDVDDFDYLESHLPGRYIVGAGTHPRAGLLGVVASVKATASLVVKAFALSSHG